MTSVLFISPVYFGSNPGISDNAFSGSARVSGQQADSDHIMANVTITEERNRLAELGFHTVLINMKDDPRGAVVYENRGDAIFPNNSISFHNFTDDKGKIVRRVVILYPMSKHRRGELPRVQILNKLDAAANSGAIELVDLRPFEEEDRCLEGTGALNFTSNGRHVYMSRSQRTDDEVLEIVCAPENLNIPKENRFVFASAIPRNDGTGEEDTVYHTNVIGWVGHRVCAWALDLLRFPTPEEEKRFHDHLKESFDCVIDLSVEEVSNFAGNACEVSTRDASGKEKHVLCISQTALDKMSASNLEKLRKWYGEEGVLGFAGEVLERRSGGSIRCSMGASFTVGDVLPSVGEKSTLEVVQAEQRC